MKQTQALFAGLAMLIAFAFVTPAFAVEGEVTLKGEMKCGKCAMKEAEKCQNVLEVKNGETMTVYWLDANDVSKAFHKNVCQANKKVSVIGKPGMEGKKHTLVASKIELDEEKK